MSTYAPRRALADEPASRAPARRARDLDAERRLPQPPPDPRRHRRPDGRHVPRRARPEHRRRRAAQDHLRARRAGQAVLGRHRLPAHLDRGHAAVGQDLRPARPAADLPGRDRRLPGRLGHLRLRLPALERARPLRHRRHDRRPRGPGPRRRRPDVAGARRHRRRHPAARARQVPGPLRRRLRRLLGRRSPARRSLHRPPRLGVDLLHQPADRRRRPGRHLVRAQAAPRARARPRSTTSARRPSSARSPAWCSTSAGPAPTAGWTSADRARPARRGRRPRRALRARRAPREGADHPARALPLLDLRRPTSASP